MNRETIAPLINVVVAALALTSCQGLFEDRDSSDPCTGVDCSGHGECVLVSEGSRAACVCDDDFVVEELECVPDGAGGDGDADTDSDSDADADTDSEDCEPDCEDRECGPDPVCGTESCGECDDTRQCTEEGRCDCIPDCGGRECGDDGCGGRCPPGCGDWQMCEGGDCTLVCDENFSWGNACYEVDECDDGSICHSMMGLETFGSICIAECGSDEDCPDVAEGFETCMMGACLIGCDSPSDCPCGLECRDGIIMPICYP